ncbi:hypothetical protein [uncultured Piscinibacter sp.]|uniref:hypothetical protein n=1 Tax=uncultured Piscinibacter sp. TaxID=1131835 RepID=UPI002636A6C3|nr:hypothetical protein [uncultured Piscinibacter sp.]
MPLTHRNLTEEHELPSLEAVLAGTLALMTGYAQALQAELHPEQRLLMGAKIGRNLEMLASHVATSEAFQRIALGLRARWQLMSARTAQSAPCACAATATVH